MCNKDRTNEKGVVLAEFAFIAALLLLLLLGTTALTNHMQNKIRAHNAAFVTTYAGKIYCASGTAFQWEDCITWIQDNWVLFKAEAGWDATNHIALYSSDVGIGVTKWESSSGAEGNTAYNTNTFSGDNVYLTNHLNDSRAIVTSDVLFKTPQYILNWFGYTEVGESRHM